MVNSPEAAGIALQEAAIEGVSEPSRESSRESLRESSRESSRESLREALRKASISSSPSTKSISSQAIPMTVQHAQQAQSHHWAAMDIQQQHHQMQQGLDEEMSQVECMQWQDQCYICHMQRHDYGHDLYSYHEPWSQVARAWMIRVRRQVHYALYIACYTCGMPQMICFGWQDSQSCQYRGILIPMVAMMLFGPWQSQVKPIWQRRLQGMGVNASDKTHIIQFLGRGHPQREGHSQLFVSFCWLRRLCQEVENNQ